MRCDMRRTGFGMHAGRVGSVCWVRTRRMVKSKIGGGTMRNEGGIGFVVVVRTHPVAENRAIGRVRALALWDAVHHLSTIIVAHAAVSRCERWRRCGGRGRDLALGFGVAGVPSVV